MNLKKSSNCFMSKTYSLFNWAFNIHPEEFWIVQMFLIFFTILCAGYVVTSTAAITLFLSKTSQAKLHEMLPWIYIGNAVTIAIIGNYYGRWIDKLSRLKLFTYAILFFILSFLLLRYIISIPGDHGPVYFFFMLWDETCSVVLIMIFYTYLGDYFHVDHAKRLYAYITGGVALGTYLGGFGSAYFLRYFATPNLLYFSIVLMAAANLITYFISKKFPGHRINVSKVESSAPFSLKQLFSNKYLSLLLFIGALAVVCTCIDSYQFFYVASRTLSEKELGSFMGKFYGYMGIALLLVNFILARWILKFLGILGSLLILPILLIIFGGSFFIYPVLMFAAMLKFADGTLFQTVNTFSLQALYLPLSEKLRVHGLSASVGIMASSARLFAGVMLVILSFFAIPIKYYALIILFVSILSIACIIYLFPFYKRIKAGVSPK